MNATHTQQSQALEKRGQLGTIDVLLAALPHLLVSTIFFGIPVAFGGLASPWYPTFLGSVLLIALIYAWRRDWPLWSGSWAGYALLALALVLGGIVNQTVFWRQSDLLSMLALVAGVILIAPRRPLHAVLASMPLLTFIPRLFSFEHLAGGDLVFGGAFVLMAVASALIAYRGSHRAAITIITVFHLLTGVAFTLGTFFLPFDLGPFSTGMEAAPRRTPSLLELLDDFLPVTAASIAASLGPLIVHAIWRRLRKTRTK